MDEHYVRSNNDKPCKCGFPGNGQRCKKKKFLGMGFWKISNSFLTFKVAAKLPIFSVIAELLFSKTTAELGDKEWK